MFSPVPRAVIDLHSQHRRTLLGALTFGVSMVGAVARPITDKRQYRVGVLGMGNPTKIQSTDAFTTELARLGLVEGRNLVIEVRGTGGEASRIEPLVAELLSLEPDVIVVGGTAGALALKRATSTVPIVFSAGDPVRAGLVTSLAHPGGNLTGNALLDLDAKRIQILSEVVGAQATIALVGGRPGSRRSAAYLADLAAPMGGRADRLVIEDVANPAGFAAAFDNVARKHVDAVAVVSSPLTFFNKELIVRLLTQYRLPAIAEGREFAEKGGLLAYGLDWNENDRRAARYVHSILTGAKPADLPVEQSSRFEMIVNLKTARALRIKIPPSVVARADETLE